MFEKERGGEMLSLLIVILVMVVLFKVTGFMFHIAGKLLGGIFGIIGWLILGGLAISVFGLVRLSDYSDCRDCRTGSRSGAVTESIDAAAESNSART